MTDGSRLTVTAACAFPTATVVEANGRYARDRLERYEARLRDRFPETSPLDGISRLIPPPARGAMASALLRIPAFVRHVALDRRFLHAEVPALTGLEI